MQHKCPIYLEFVKKQSTSLFSSFFLCEPDLCSQHLPGHCILGIAPYKTVREWHSVTQGTHLLYWHASTITMSRGCLLLSLRTSWWMVWVSLLREKDTLRGSENPVYSHGSSWKCTSWDLYSDHCTVVCVPGFCPLSSSSTSWNSQWGFLELKEGFKI